MTAKTDTNNNVKANTNNVKQIRHQIRTSIRYKRLSLSQSFQEQAAQQLVIQLSTHPKVNNANHVAIYLTNNGELNTTPFIKWCWVHNIKTYLPVIHPFSKGNLLFLEYNSSTEMKTNQYGILEPKLDVRNIRLPHTIDIIFTPLVAFDLLGSRLGMGGGFYDRTLQHWFPQYKLNNATLPYPIGLAHECQQVNYIPTENWDIPIPEIVTPTQNFKL